MTWHWEGICSLLKVVIVFLFKVQLCLWSFHYYGDGEYLTVKTDWLLFILVQWSPEPLKRVDDSSWRTFLKRLIDFFKPCNNIFGRIELGKDNADLFVKA